MSANDIIISISITVVFGLVVNVIWDSLKIMYPNIVPIKLPIRKHMNIRATRILWLILKYGSPIVTMVFLIIYRNQGSGFLNLYIFIATCFFYVYNLLMGHVISIYGMIAVLTNKTASDFLIVDGGFKSIKERIKSLESKIPE